jgi:hypothetical protein
MKAQWAIKIGRGFFDVRSLKECRAALVCYRDESTHGRSLKGLGSSEFLKDDGAVLRNGKRVGHFSYNGRFWGER